MNVQDIIKRLQTIATATGASFPVSVVQDGDATNDRTIAVSQCDDSVLVEWSGSDWTTQKIAQYVSAALHDDQSIICVMSQDNAVVTNQHPIKNEDNNGCTS